MPAYYNEHDPKAAAWLRELIAQNLIAPGIVDERCITKIQPHELTSFSQCHFFAGIGGWSLALRLAGWSDDRPVWTGSCPCQPFSVAGKNKGTDDERHLWPVFAELIRSCKPPVVFGEQVASKSGRGWLAGVLADLEGMGYRRAAADLCAAGVGAPHIRQRLYWVADDDKGLQRHRKLGELQVQEKWEREKRHGSESSSFGGVALTYSTDEREREKNKRRTESAGDCKESRMGLSHSDGCSERGVASSTAGHGPPVEPASFWNDSLLASCRDGKTRRVPSEPAFFPLANGIPARVVRLRGYGNAIVPQVAAQFIRAYEEAVRDERFGLQMNDPLFT